MSTPKSTTHRGRGLLLYPIVAALGVALIGTPSASAASTTATTGSLAGSQTAIVDSPPSVTGEPLQTIERAGSMRRGSSSDPASWSRKRLASKLVLAGVTSTNLTSARSWVRGGIGGIVLFGTPPTNLEKQLKALKRKSPDGHLLIASDEEGGSVQRLSRLIGRMPSAKTIGATKTPRQTKRLAFTYGKRMKVLGVNNDLAPVADLAYRGSYTDRDRRAFSANPRRNGRYVTAFATGLQKAGVLATVKHWPGGGAVANTHTQAGRTPPWRSVQHRDLVPFRAAFAGGVGSVMVSHARVPGLTGRLPASQSKAAMKALRADAGDAVVIMTDSLAMAAVTKSMGQSQQEAAVRAIAAGSDLALIQGDTKKMVRALQKAIKRGKISRDAAVASARRIVAAQSRF
ncbi:MAG: hypothetical protein HQ526_09925 [Actinobacteria bacterium]|nr:hypothetical protein [Actinomycetota bacterium]